MLMPPVACSAPMHRLVSVKGDRWVTPALVKNFPQLVPKAAVNESYEVGTFSDSKIAVFFITLLKGKL